MVDRNDISLTGQCDLIKAGPCGMVIFGASGDLTRRKLLASLFNLVVSGGVGEEFFILGVARTRMTDEMFRTTAADSVRDVHPAASPRDISAFCARCYYLSGAYDSDGTYSALKQKLSGLSLQYSTQGNIVFNLATPPILYGVIVEFLGRNGLIGKNAALNPFQRVMVEKPFGLDLEAARELNRIILNRISDDQIFRIDHYLGKNTVQNLLVFRFANAIFTPVWNSQYIDHVQITVSETIGVENRAGYFEQAGLVRDMLQNHMLQLLALVAMETPSSLESRAIMDEKYKVLKAIRRFDLGRLNEQIVRGQYAEGTVDGKKAVAYRQEPGVDPNSCVETYFAARMFIDNKRWRGVPFYLRAGKRLSRTGSTIKVVFKNTGNCLFCVSGVDQPVNRLTFALQPEQSVSLKFIVKIPGAKMCLSALDMDFNYKSLFPGPLTGDYERIILDCMLGDQTLFWRKDGVEESWKLLTPVIRRWQSCPIGETTRQMNLYPAGSEGPEAANELIRRDGREWL